MSNNIANLIASFNASLISDFFIYLIAGLLVVSVTLLIFNRMESFIRGVPNVLTSLGILGTFAGIVVGLMDFDPQNIDGSIEQLLNGLKTAFLTSLVGMASSIILKVVTSAFSYRSNDKVAEVGPEDIYQVLNSHLTTSNELLSSIKGDDDSSLTSHLSKLRLDISDHHKANEARQQKNEERQKAFSEDLWIKMDTFGELLSKSATEQVINALKEVIVDFNEKLTEQFGENFKRLDESVKKLVDWQENYRQQLEDMSYKYQLGVEAIESTEKSVASINDRTEAIPATMEKLHSVMEIGHGQVTELEMRLEAFKDLRDKAVEAMPQIREQMDSTMSVMGDSVKAASTHYEDMLAESKKVIESFTETADSSIQVMRSNLEEGAEKVSHELTQSAHDISGKLAEASTDIQNNVSSAAGGLNTVTNHLTDATDQIRQHLDDSITELNGQLRVLVADIKEDSKETGNVLKEANKELIQSTKDSQETTIKAISKLHDRLETTLEEVFQIQAQAVQRTFDSLEDQLTSTVSQTGGAVEKQVEVLDYQMQQEINRTMNEMGTALATITQQFTRDYQKLVNEMNRVVQTAAMA